jgi:hypothetical protein
MSALLEIAIDAGEAGDEPCLLELDLACQAMEATMMRRSRR